jgi:hypothetical protein
MQKEKEIWGRYETIQTIKEPTLEWNICNNVIISGYEKKTWYNRFKWWIATKLFLPGTYRWIK